MRRIDFTEITFLQMQVFITAGRELNFTRTANQCHITQPTVSRLIDSLEKTTGLQLFIRKRSGLQLTPAGKALHVSFSQTLEKMERDFQNAFEIQEGYHNFLNICITDGINPHDIYEIIKRMRKKDEMIRVHYQLARSFDQEIGNLFNYSSDILITHMHNKDLILHYTDLFCEELIVTPLTVFMKRTNPLSCKRTLTYSDLRSQKIIFPQESNFIGYESMINSDFAKANIRPTISYRTASAAEGIMNLHDDDEVLILNHFVPSNYLERCVEIPLEGSRSGLLLVTRTADTENKLITEFKNQAKEYAKLQDYTLDV